MTSRFVALSFCAIAALPAARAFATNAVPAYQLTQSIPLGAPDGWNYLTFEAPTHRVYIAHGDRLTVVDGRTGAIVGTVDGMPRGSHGIAISHATDPGYADGSRAGVALAFDLRTLKVTDMRKAEDDADGVVLDPASGHAFVIGSDPGKLTVIDPKTNQVIATVDDGGKLEFGVADGNGNLFVNGKEKREIVRVDTRTNKADAHWSIAGCESPHGVAMDTSSRRLFVSCHNRVTTIVDADSGRVVGTVPIGNFTDRAAFDPIRKLAFSSKGEGTVTVASATSPNTCALIGNVKTRLGGRTMTVDPETGRLFVVAADISVNESVPMADFKDRYHVSPGSAGLLFLDPGR